MNGRPEWPQLGDKVREITTKHEGILTGYTEYLWGCSQVLLSRLDKDGKEEGAWYDIARIEILQRAALKPVQHVGAPVEPAPRRPRGAGMAAPIR